jgi:hypothetical protein
MNSASVRQNLEFEGESVSLFIARPFQLTSTLDMLRVYAGLAYSILTQIEGYETQFKKKCDNGKGDDVLTPKEKNRFSVITGMALMECGNLELIEPLKRKRKIRRYIDPPHGRKRVALRLTYDKAHAQLEELRDAILSELQERIFLRIPTDRESYYCDEDEKQSPLTDLAKIIKNKPYKPLFDDETKPLEKRFSQRWPTANEEIVAAGNCYATGNNTACVLHLMRAVEHGARAMVAGLGVTDKLQYPIELCSWEDLIQVLEPPVRALRTRKLREQNREWEFYDKALGHFQHFRAWRDPIAHARRTAQEGETKDALNNVRQFMVHLNERLEEQPLTLGE